MGRVMKSFTYPPGATPLNRNEIDGLLLPISTQAELDQAEYQAILDARSRYQRRIPTLGKFLDISEFKRIHGIMFEVVWEWAGTFRSTEKNIGVAPHQIQPTLYQLFQNLKVRVNTTMDAAARHELAADFHHRAVFIHAFPNGNGRHARFVTDIFCQLIEQTPPTWIAEKMLTKASDCRAAYIAALKSADSGDLGPLTSFMFKH